MEKPLVNKKYTLQKFKGKGGWTFAKIPEIKQNKKSPFGWVKVKGSIDGVEIKKYSLMPMGNSKLFLAVNADLRKKIKKKEGDVVHIVLYPDDDPIEIPNEMLLCLEDEPKAMDFFNSLSESEQMYYIKWVYSAKKEETKINRLATSINRLLKREKFYEAYTKQ